MAYKQHLCDEHGSYDTSENIGLGLQVGSTGASAPSLGICRIGLGFNWQPLLLYFSHVCILFFALHLGVLVISYQ